MKIFLTGAIVICPTTIYGGGLKRELKNWFNV
jgi:hypothetical protein